MAQSQSRFGLGFDLGARDVARDEMPDDPVQPTEDTEPIGPEDIAAQTASHLAQEQAAEAAFEALEPAERIAEVLKQMAPRRKELLAIIEACDGKVVRFDEVETMVESIQQNCKTVFNSANLCAVLEHAGALVRVTESGEPYPTGSFEPTVVENADGTKSLVPVEPPAVYWTATAEGVQVAEADDPGSRLRGMLEEEPQYLPIYARMLSLCSEANGATTAALGEAIDHDPLVQNPRYFAMHFSERLEANDAIEWNSKTWAITEIGRTALANINEHEEN